MSVWLKLFARINTMAENDSHNSINDNVLFKKGPTPAAFCLFSFFSTIILQNCGLQCGFQTLIIGIEGEHGDHLDHGH